MQCPTCRKEIGCSCQMKNLSNGQQVCVQCFQAEQSKINVENARKLQALQNPPKQ